MAKHDVCSPSFATTFCARHGIALSPVQAEQLAGYVNLLMQWNKVMNLVGVRHWRDALEELIIDSLYLARFLQDTVLPDLSRELEIWDLGAGAGLPGIPLRIVWDKGNYWLVESRDKRTIFLSTVLARFPLAHTQVFRGRAEQFMQNKKADLIVSRAFMPWKELLAFVLEHLNPGGRIVFLTHEELTTDESLPCWVSAGHAQYTVGGSIRHFCVFRQHNS